MSEQQVTPQAKQVGFPWHVGVRLSDEAEALRKQYEKCPTEDIPESVQKHWLALTGLAGSPLTLRELSAGVPGPPKADDSYELRLTGYPSLVSGDGLKPVKPWRLEDQDRDTLLGIAQRSVVRLRGQSEHIRTLEQALSTRNEQRRALSHELRLMRWVSKAAIAKQEAGLVYAAEALKAQVDQHTENLRGLLQAAENQAASWQTECRRETAEHQKTREQVSLLTSECEKLKERNDDLFQAAENYRAAVVRAEQTEKILRKEIEQLVGERDKAREELHANRVTRETQREIEAIIEQRTAAERHLESLKLTIKDLEENNRSLTAQLQSATKGSENAYTRGFNDGREALYQDVQQLVASTRVGKVGLSGA